MLWTTLYSSGAYGNIPGTRAAFDAAVRRQLANGDAIIWRECLGCAGTHQNIYFKRLTGAGSTSPTANGGDARGPVACPGACSSDAECGAGLKCGRRPDGEARAACLGGGGGGAENVSAVRWTYTYTRPWATIHAEMRTQGWTFNRPLAACSVGGCPNKPYPGDGCGCSRMPYAATSGANDGYCARNGGKDKFLSNYCQMDAEPSLTLFANSPTLQLNLTLPQGHVDARARALFGTLGARSCR